MSLRLVQVKPIIDYKEVAKLMIKDLTLLNDICAKSFTQSDKLSLLKEMDNLTNELRHEFPFLLHAIDNLIFDNFNRTLPTEKEMQISFKERLCEFLPSAKAISKNSNSKHRPDLWLAIDGEEVPVEMKLNAFDSKALRQLQRYMNFYNCKKGIAVAKELDCKIPDNITFLEFKF